MRYETILQNMKRSDQQSRMRAAATIRFGSKDYKPGVGAVGPIMGRVRGGAVQFRTADSGHWPLEGIKLAGANNASRAFLGTNTVKH